MNDPTRTATEAPGPALRDLPADVYLQDGRLQRCPLCDGFVFPRYRDRYRCAYCGLVAADISHYNNSLEEFSEALRKGFLRLPNARSYGPKREGLRFFPHTLEMLALKHRMVSTAPIHGGPLSQLALAVTPRITSAVTPLDDLPPPREALGLGVMCRPGEVADACGVILNCAPVIAAVGLVVDTDDEQARAAAEAQCRAALAAAGHDLPLMVRARLLNSDFGAQRSALQETVGTPWVLQMDSDERLSEDALAVLPSLIAMAERKHRRAIALPRVNLVDGIKTAQYPDRMIRVLRREVRFHLPVHEQPLLAWHEPINWVGPGHIEHRLDKARVIARSRRYEGITEGAGNPFEQRLLLTTFDGHAIR